MLDIAKITKSVDRCWSDEIVPTLVEYIKIPNKSPAFDPDWAAHGYMDEAVALFERWARDLRAVAQDARLTLELSPNAVTVMGGRRGKHSDGFLALLDELTEVYRIEPEAAW